ncbi:MAG TPA: adenylyl-sulfate kinase [Nitrosopumilaceae archaeon]|nr:adenylyl-sulfate kinase [Nitrosopumilaceae archaeon]
MAFVLWMTGLPCSGKTTIARKLQEFVPNLAILDGDELREWLSPKDFSREGRNEHNRKVAHLAKLLLKHNVPVIVSLISPYFENRKYAREIIGKENFIETYVKCSLNVCEERDVKGMYKKARNNEIKSFTGIDDPYDVPATPELIIETQDKSLDESVKQILDYLRRKAYLIS